MESTSTPPLPLHISKFYQILVGNRVRVWRSQQHIPTKYYGEYLHPTPPLPAGQEQGIKILPNSGQEQGKGLEEPAAHTHQILWRVPPPHPLPLPISKFYQMLVRNRVQVWRSQWHIVTKYYGEYLHSTPPPPPPHIKILPNSGREQGKGLEEPVAHTHQIYYGEYLHPTPSPNAYQNSTKFWLGTG